ncbi:hypothetical protein HKX48_007386 [Thoreauomyces humboldtii]|nr:hypothetical protein HKX48_007386 [Thoreauomyces humboldtii]
MSSHPAPSPVSGSGEPSLSPPSPSPHHERVPISQTLAAESLSAAASATLVAPIITIIDRSIFLNASGTEPLLRGLASGTKSFLGHPLTFFKQPACVFMWAVYFGTYWTANTIQSVCDYEGWDWFWPKAIGTSVANVGLCVAKDATFTRWFGNGVAKPVSLTTYSLYTSRDVLTVFASFNLPPILAPRIAQSLQITQGQSEVLSQLLTPCAVQLVSTPMHLLGMDLYNRPHATAPERRVHIREEYIKSTAARIGRIFAAFGIGGVANQWFRHESKEMLREFHGQ